MICSIPICLWRLCDTLAWVDTKNGMFIVKSAYHLAAVGGEATNGSTSDTTVAVLQWKNIWNIRGPPVVKTFLWQACNEILPTGNNLHRKGIISDSLCPICGVANETVGHILWNCSSACAVWLECLKPIHRCSLLDDSFTNIMDMLYRKLDADQLQLVAITMRLLWRRRNTWVFDGAF